jgi:NAD(P)-dependent dehydrogenase (short-subunit alcohol dehydrogenase family)
VGLVAVANLGQTVVRDRSSGSRQSAVRARPRKTMTTTDGGQPIVLLVELFVRPDRVAEFHRFEREAARIMRRHGGPIDRVIRPTGPGRGDALPFYLASDEASFVTGTELVIDGGMTAR